MRYGRLIEKKTKGSEKSRHSLFDDKMKYKNIVAEKKEDRKKADLKDAYQRVLPFNPLMPRYYSRTERAELRELEKRILMKSDVG